ncbi:hypothetical protein A3C26_02225 [Candidatus Daviesbacteria bacterium RIFCSPHIGHO2_02_FULL_39_12]|uniref:Prepilin-type N-terminal cleavage/methylation domain-containing protein n=2 Tax=Candidatus Daviesiibacteriota TaxID=1752718 RepID=A0A1F5JA45_9BACT|nr:MAG: hypothetical protein A3C26_02225 [Candidatus Daviesbacteria bacterium RIFCSPHIGHO2_02_FULL_39_12]OGE71673.1 MAG: hypothetical protein A3H40_01535 [Candidatus Daviesbacteria bacterium RIFCSPLOWO2_02_FULL_38_15]
MKRKFQIRLHLEGVKAHLRGGLSFTLVELLVVMGVLAIVGTLILVIFTNALKGNNKTQIVGIIKQNGQAVLEVMDKTIRNADNIVCVTTSGKTLAIVKNGVYTRYRFVPPNNTNLAIGNCGNRTGEVTANGCFQQDSPVQPTPPAAGSDMKLFIDGICVTDYDSLINPITLTDTNSQTGVSVECINNSCTSPNEIFKKGPSAGFKDQVTVKFQVAPAVGVPQSVAGQIDAAQFQTTVQLR